MAAPPSLRHQQRLQLISINRALHQQQLSIKMMNSLQRQRQNRLKSTQHYPRNVHLMPAPKAPRQSSSPNPFVFGQFPQQPFTPFQFTPFQFTPFQFQQFPNQPFTPFQFQAFPGAQKKPPKIIGTIGKTFIKLPLKSLKLLKLLKPFKPKGKMGRGLFRRRRRGLFGRNRRGGRLGLLRLLGMRGRRRGRGRGGFRVPFTPLRIGGMKGRGRRRGPNRRRRRVVKRPATMRQRLERQRWGKAGRRAERRHRRTHRRL